MSIFVMPEQCHCDKVHVEPTHEGRLVHSDGVIINCNATVAKMLGYKRQELIGKDLLKHLPSECRSIIKEKIDSRATDPYVVSGVRRDGSPLICLITAVNCVYNGRRARMAALLDVTEQMMSRDELEQSRRTITDLETALQKKETALREILNHIDNRHREYVAGIQVKIEKVAGPLLDIIENRINPDDRQYMILLRDCLMELGTPMVSSLEKRFSQLSPRELQVCNMIKNGLVTKEIAHLLRISCGTVFTQRKMIRRKLGVVNEKVSLVSYLRSHEAIDPDE